MEINESWLVAIKKQNNTSQQTYVIFHAVVIIDIPRNIDFDEGFGVDFHSIIGNCIEDRRHR